MSWPDVVALLSVLATLVVALLAFFRGRRTDGASAAQATDRRLKVLEDYCYDLRRALAASGAPVPPWPDELKDGHGD